MKTQDRVEEAKRYRQRKAAQGYKIMTFLMPIVLVEDVRHYIRKRTNAVML